MTINIMNLLKSYFGEDVIGKLGSLTGADTSSIRNALGYVLPAVMGKIVDKGSEPQGAFEIMNIIKKGGYGEDSFNDMSTALSNDETGGGLIETGKGLAAGIFGDRISDLVDWVSTSCGIGKNAVSSLLNISLPTVFGILGKQVKERSLNVAELLNFLTDQAEFIKAQAPVGLSGVLGLSNVSKPSTVSSTPMAQSSTGSTFWKWLLPLIIIVALFIFLFRSCNTPSEKPVANKMPVSAEISFNKTDSPAATVTEKAASVTESIAAKATDAAASVTEKAKEMAGAAAEKTATVMTSATETVKEATSSTAEKAASTAETAAQKATDTAASVTEKAKEMAGAAVQSVTAGAGSVKQIATEMSTDVANKAASLAKDGLAALGKTTDINLPNGKSLKIPENGIEKKLVTFIETPGQLGEKDTWFTFDGLQFKLGSATLKSSSVERLKNIAAIMKAYPNVHLKIGGHTDNLGNADNNLLLSSKRSLVALQQLVKLGVAPDRLQAEGYGDKVPVADNSTMEGRRENRRVEIQVTMK
jgi:OmpA-OmpF porin, OOP family